MMVDPPRRGSNERHIQISTHECCEHNQRDKSDERSGLSHKVSSQVIPSEDIDLSQLRFTLVTNKLEPDHTLHVIY
jgi:hypothetical protein